MNYSETLEKVIVKSLSSGKVKWDVTIDEWNELSDAERSSIIDQMIKTESYMGVIFNHNVARALWGDEKYMGYYAGYNEWADATSFTGDPDDLDYDEVPRDRMPLFEYHLMMMARSKNRLKYIAQNI